jgi:multicomponent Na+:H+ antiporter subunit B
VTVLQIAALALVALGGTGVVLASDPLRQTIILSIFGLALAVLFFVFQAPDVALSEVVVSTVGLPILFGSVLGIVLILRELRDEHEGPSLDEAEEHTFGGASEALRMLVLILVPVLLAVGGYIVAHGQITPGGGFQGGIVLATAPLALFLAGRYLRTRFVSPHTLLEVGEAVGAAGYAMVGIAGLVFVGIFFKNFLPLGIPGHLLSAGQIDVASVAVGVEVSGAFLVAWIEFLDQAIMVRRRRAQ